jgi:hypothetical protein
VKDTKGTERIETTSDSRPRTERTGKSGAVTKPKQPEEKIRRLRYRPNSLIAFHLPSRREPNYFRDFYRDDDGTYRI